MAYAIRVDKDPVLRNEEWSGCGIFLLGLFAGVRMNPRDALAAVADLRRRVTPEIHAFTLPDGRTVRLWKEN